MNVSCQLTDSLVIPISKRLDSMVILTQCCIILISLYMPYLIVINRWHRPFWVHNTWPHRSSPLIPSCSLALFIIFFDSALALAYPPSLFRTRINIYLPNDFVAERVKLAVAWVKVGLHGMCGLISAQTLHRLTCLLHYMIQGRLLPNTTGTFQKRAVVCPIHFYLAVAYYSSFLEIETSWRDSWGPDITFLMWTCLLLGEEDILFRLLNITLILAWKLILNYFLSLLLRDRKCILLQVHVEIHLECSGFLVLLVIIVDPKT